MMHKMHDGIGNDNWICAAGLCFDPFGRGAMEATMTIDQGAGNFWERSAHSLGLPKKVRLRGSATPSAPVYEFEVIAGNASYREGERFYLTPAQAERAYFSARRNV
jgi:hypothetical protein